MMEGREGESLGDFHSALVAGFPRLPPTHGTRLAEPGLTGWATLWSAPHQPPFDTHTASATTKVTVLFCYMTNHQMSRERDDTALLSSMKDTGNLFHLV